MLFDPEKYKRLHNRTISITTYAYDTDAVALEGHLTDNRFVDTYTLFGDQRPAGIVHDLVVRMIVRGPKLVIEAVEAEMVTVPHEACPEAIDSLAPLKGERITAGFTTKVHKLVGGRQGCAHLLALCRAMASAAIQGAYSMVAQQPPEKRKLTMNSLKNVLNTCHLWRADGPMVQALKEKIESDQ